MVGGTGTWLPSRDGGCTTAGLGCGPWDALVAVGGTMLSSAILVMRSLSVVRGFFTGRRGMSPRMFLIEVNDTEPRMFLMAGNGRGFPERLAAELWGTLWLMGGRGTTAPGIRDVLGLDVVH